MELGAKGNDGLSQQACTAFAEEYPASAGRHASDETDYARISRSLWPDALQHFENAATCPWPSSARKTKQSYNSQRAMWQSMQDNISVSIKNCCYEKKMKYS